MLTKCWIFTGAVNDSGYGVAGVDGKIKYTHRAAYEVLVGPIPDGLELDHSCKVKICYNPYHLEAVTHIENVRRSVSFNGTKTHCKNGHEFNDENTVWRKSGGRGCRPCNRNTYKKWYDKNR